MINDLEIESIQCQSIAVEKTIALRHTVLWPNAPISHVCLPEDRYGYHLGAFLPANDQPIAVISLFVESMPIDNNAPSHQITTLAQTTAVRFRKFACNPAYQNHGIGTKLLLHAIAVARSELKATTLWCDARTSSSGWYRKRGLVPFGETFWKSSVEYVRMKLTLSCDAC